MENINLLPEISEKSDVILKQLMKAKAEMGSSVKKDLTNPFHKSKYASLGAHLELTEPVLANHGLIMLQAPNVVNNQNILVATLHHPESGQWIKSYLPLPNPKADSQGIGASITYMRRYSMNVMFNLNAEDDDGETASGRGKYDKQAAKENNTPPTPETKKQEEKAPVAPSVELIGKEEFIALSNLIKKLDAETNRSFFEWINKTFNAQFLKDVPKSAFERCMISLNNKIKLLKDQQKNMVVA